MCPEFDSEQVRKQHSDLSEHETEFDDELAEQAFKELCGLEQEPVRQQQQESTWEPHVERAAPQQPHVESVTTAEQGLEAGVTGRPRGLLLADPRTGR